MQLIEEIEEAIEFGNTAGALERMRCLFQENLPLSVRDCAAFLRFIRELVPEYPRPHIPSAAIEYCSVAHDIIAFAKRHKDSGLQSAAETTAYRWHEGRGEYAQARAVIASMQLRADKAGDPWQLGVMTNNYGYEYLLEGNHEEAEPYFRQAVDLFEIAEREDEMANGKANILTSSFATLPLEQREALLPDLAETQKALHGCRNWRIRKTMRLYAERAEQDGRLSVAVAWARRAADASRNIPTKLHQEDDDYAASLERRQRTSRRRSMARPAGREKFHGVGTIVTPSRAPSKKYLLRETLMGVETEYAFTPFGTGNVVLNRTDYSRRLVSLAAQHYPLLRGRDGYDCFLANGSRLYVDSGLGLINVEYASAECTKPEELVAQVRAGDRILASLARELEQNHRELRNAFISKCNLDYSGHTSGSHENFLHTSSHKKLAPQLIPHLVSRIIYTGGAGFDDSARHIDFMLSPRVRFLERVKSAGAQENRAIFTTKQEPLSRSRYRRLHLLCGEGVRYDMAEYLRFGVTALLIRLVDSGVRLADGIELEPLRAINIVARDISCKKTIGSVNGVPATAIDVQRHYLSQVRTHVGRPYLPDWADTLCERWQATLDMLETDVMQLCGILDWPTKLSLYRSFVEQRGCDWQRLTHAAGNSRQTIREELFELDVRFGDISEEGLFASLARDTRPGNRLVSERAIDDAMRIPPQGTRAKLRGEWVERLSQERAQKQCGWEFIHDDNENLSLLFDDPFGSSTVEWA